MLDFLTELLRPRPAADLRERFTAFYRNNTFGGTRSRSGEGSSLAQTAVIRRELPKLVAELGIKSFVDAPCGDWFWMKETELGVAEYIGVDIVEQLVELNNRQFEAPSRRFLCLNLATDALPQADLIFCRDCLVHLNFRDIRRVIANFQRSESRYLLTTTFTNRERNVDLEGKDVWRTLNLQTAPFNFPPPLRIINEGCTEAEGLYFDKSLGLWRLGDLPV
jgi:hypothetical protein